MSKTLEKRAVAAETIANARLEAEANVIFRKYCFDSHRIATEATKQEQEIIWRWGTPHLKETFENFMNVFFSPLIADFFEEWIFPKILLYGDLPGNDGLVLAFDNLFIEVVYSDLWHRFVMECRNSPNYETDPEAAAKWRISMGLAEEFKKAHERLDKVKARSREKLQKKLVTLKENE